MRHSTNRMVGANKIFENNNRLPRNRLPASASQYLPHKTAETYQNLEKKRASMDRVNSTLQNRNANNATAEA